ncbi:MAG: endonuclease MutS2 [Wolinella sp.]
MQHYLRLAKKLDLEPFLELFGSFFARAKPIYMEGDIHRHKEFISALEPLLFTPPPPIPALDRDLVHLKKFGFLRREEIFEWVKLWRYMLYLKSLHCEGILLEWFSKIQFPAAVLEIERHFDKEGNFGSGIYPELDSVNISLKRIKSDINEALRTLLSNMQLAPYLVDRQIHLIEGEESLLLRGGFNNAIKAQIIGRSAAGFFYAIPESIARLKSRESELLSKITEMEFNICKELSAQMGRELAFLKFINREFDRFDHYQARINFAKAGDLEFITPKSDRRIRLVEFAHPVLSNPKVLNIDFERDILLITGVNAGGKTMLLKSLLSASFLARYLIPMKINAHKSHIGTFKGIDAILDDPQSAKNDISTFAGRMVEFERFFKERGFLIGIDEIELGTDSDEAASLFKVILEELLKREYKIIITTHHKRLAALMANNERVELMAALYDEKRQTPTFSFLQGTIGKSYAFETAERYGIPAHVIRNAKALYGEDKEKLGELIEKSAQLEIELKQKSRQMDLELEKLKAKKGELADKIEQKENEYRALLTRMEREYKEAISAAKEAAKETNTEAIHKGMNNANKILQNIKKDEEARQNRASTHKGELKVGERVKYRQNRGVVLSLSENEAMIELDEGFKLRVKKGEIKLLGDAPRVKIPTPKVHFSMKNSSALTLDLHGLRSEEAIERLDKFLSDALITGFDEVLVYHGIGTGKLAYAVKEFLKTHPKVRSFEDAPPQMGGFGAKIIKF